MIFIIFIIILVLLGLLGHGTQPAKITTHAEQLAAPAARVEAPSVSSREENRRVKFNESVNVKLFYKDQPPKTVAAK